MFETPCRSASKTRVNALMARLLTMRPGEVTLPQHMHLGPHRRAPVGTEVHVLR